MLRSALTLNEIRINTGRMVSFESADELQALLEALMEREEPLIVRIPRAAGQREDRYAHLLCGEPDIDIAVPSDIVRLPVRGKVDPDRITQLEKELADLKEDVAQLRALIENT